MTPETQAELLIRIDERVNSMHETMSAFPCRETQKQITAHSEKLKFHDKFIWGIAGTLLTAIGSFFVLIAREIINISKMQ